ncbi:MAG: 50S ribosomal protein L17 [Candidatus Pacebacteria bacterium]|nr:50S ribosomal protein L17 [Candidatus Paceibacterota bacterium]
MNHKVRGRKFKRDSAQRKALMISLAESIITRERIKTTTAKAKELSPFIEKLITRAKVSDLSAAKAIHGTLSDVSAKKLLGEIAKKYEKRNGGYTRIVKVGERQGDAAEMSIIEFV